MLESGYKSHMTLHLDRVHFWRSTKAFVTLVDSSKVDAVAKEIGFVKWKMDSEENQFVSWNSNSVLYGD